MTKKSQFADAAPQVQEAQADAPTGQLDLDAPLNNGAPSFTEVMEAPEPKPGVPGGPDGPPVPKKPVDPDQVLAEALAVQARAEAEGKVEAPKKEGRRSRGRSRSPSSNGRSTARRGESSRSRSRRSARTSAATPDAATPAAPKANMTLLQTLNSHSPVYLTRNAVAGLVVVLALLVVFVLMTVSGGGIGS